MGHCMFSLSVFLFVQGSNKTASGEAGAVQHARGR